MGLAATLSTKQTIYVIPRYQQPKKRRMTQEKSPSMQTGDGWTPGAVQRNAPVDRGVQEGRERERLIVQKEEMKMP